MKTLRTFAVILSFAFCVFGINTAQAQQNTLGELLKPDAVSVGAINVRSLENGQSLISYGHVGPRWVLAANNRAVLLTGISVEIAPTAGNYGLFIPVIGSVNVAKHLNVDALVIGIQDIGSDSTTSFAVATGGGITITAGKYRILAGATTTFTNTGWRQSITPGIALVIPLPQ